MALLGADVTEEYLLCRYDGVIHLVTAADGALAFYKHRETQDDQGNLVFRRETAEQAVALDRRTQECWAYHPHLIIVSNPQAQDGSHVGLEGFRRKLSIVTESVLTIARQAHPLYESAE